MNQEFFFDKKEDLLEKLQSLITTGIKKENITVITPYPINEIDEFLKFPSSKVKFFALIGALTGLITGFAFTIYTALSWPLITGGKPIISIPAFVIIAFELTILFGALASFLGFLIFSKLPGIKQIISPVEYENKFVIIVERN